MLKELVQRVIDLDPRIVAIEMTVRCRRELAGAHVEVKIAREIGH